MRSHPLCELLPRFVIADGSVALNAVECINHLPPVNVGLDDVSRMVDAVSVEPSRRRVGSFQTVFQWNLVWIFLHKFITSFLIERVVLAAVRVRRVALASKERCSSPYLRR